ncbi:hypothetical protein TTHERM_00833800 (macronuclear) [Tetrahymena thermophila SB210]|uniref:Zinc carboxypeptidase family protein n=1 Tax=Tetrahymena thermophila (strain SB210) TaxID=312017 RepID=Q23A38_TETTS|nr:hypothetical protein TTHERM_00833800 [Tetrahymena thermophila SB210]EAR93442.2 hypothetical protein TTHERM_00833800 [Tetrahymena thermophila SB210]|eukprot:XP_001013687.2 hypothetical protein TTHERM_00833800 [Tetrahymena thermophila SB210]
MDQQKLQKFQNCNKHSKKKLKFIQVNQVRDQPTSNLFYCTDCINEDLNFKGINYLLIEQIILQGENCILQKWPPVNDQQIVEKLIMETSKFDQSQYVFQRITNYFAELRDEVNRKIEYCQKQMIKNALDLPLGKDQIIKQYQQISQIQQLRSLIIENKNNKLDSQVEQKFKNFISELELKKDQNTEQLQKLLEKSTQQQQLVNFEYPNMIKQQILSFIDKINFFDNDLIDNRNSNNRDQPQKVYNICDKLMPLISNKSNYCADDFLNFVRNQLEKLDFLFEKFYNFQLLNSMNEETIKNLLLILIEKQLIANNQKQSETFKIKENELFIKYDSQELEKILKEFPIFDIIPKGKIDILNNLQLIKSELNDGDKRIYIRHLIDQKSIEIGTNEENYYGKKKGQILHSITNIQKEKIWYWNKEAQLNVEYGQEDKYFKFLIIQNITVKKLKFIQVNQVNSSAEQNLFYCTDCINEDLNFQAKNYILIEQIIQQGENSIIQKWPPVNDYSVIEKLIKETSKFDQSQHIIQRVTNYFTELKDEIIRRIDFCQKKMINQIQDLPFGKSQIINQYQQISQILQLRSLINESKDDKTFQQSPKQEKFKNFITEIELKKDQNTKQLQQLLDQSVKQQYLINFELPNIIKEQIFSFVDKINFFNHGILNSSNNNHVDNQSESTNFCTKIIQLISNKSNFCSNEFLNQVKQKLEKLSALIEDIPTQNMFIQGKKPIEFEKLTDEKMNQINEFVQHQIQLQSNSNYQREIQQSKVIKDIQKIMENKLNFINQASQKTIINHLTETYPYLKKDENTYIIQELEKFELFNQIDEEMIDDLFSLMKKKQEIRNCMYTSQTQIIQNIQKFEFFKKENLDRIFRQFPIFDLIPLQKISILNVLQFLKGTFNDGDQRIQISKSNLNQYEISVNDELYTGEKRKTFANCMSSMILEKDTKYIFRVQFKLIDISSTYFQIGIMDQKNLNSQEGYKDQKYVEFKYKNKQLKLDCIRFNNYLKGKDLQLAESTIIELRVWLKGKILQITDYPQNNYIVSIKNEQLEKLQNLEKPSFFVQLFEQQKSYIITEALIVQNFDI